MADKIYIGALLPKSNVGTEQKTHDRLRDAHARRLSYVGQRTLDAWRVVNGAGDDAPAGLTIDRYGDWWVVTARAECRDADVEAWCAAARDFPGVRGVVLKTLRRPVRESSSRVWSGEPPPRPLPIREDDVTILCDLDDGISTGLFLDQREVRREVRAFARDVDVLNLFAYTCSFSVHAARAGARRVTSVDAAKRALMRGRDNMIASGLDPDQHRWFPDDARTHLARAARRRDAYGLVIMDPPVFGRAGAKVHSLGEQLEELVTHAAAVVAPGGVLVLSAHALELTQEDLADTVQRALGPRRATQVGERGLPWDHPARPEAGDRGDYLKTMVLRLA
jgi:23S rRNA (cytosine1962-C5)-methyltransferase